MEKLREFLEIANPLAIFRAPAVPVRNLYRCAPKKEELGYQAQVGFQDSYALHIMNLAVYIIYPPALLSLLLPVAESHYKYQK